MMSTAMRDAMPAHRPGKRTFVITRSTFFGAGSHVGKWLGLPLGALPFLYHWYAWFCVNISGFYDRE